MADLFAGRALVPSAVSAVRFVAAGFGASTRVRVAAVHATTIRELP
jgi:hypothetical protein